MRDKFYEKRRGSQPLTSPYTFHLPAYCRPLCPKQELNLHVRRTLQPECSASANSAIRAGLPHEVDGKYSLRRKNDKRKKISAFGAGRESILSYSPSTSSTPNLYQFRRDLNSRGYREINLFDPPTLDSSTLDPPTSTNPNTT